MLNGMGARILGAGTNRIVVHGVEELHGTTARIGSDLIEAVSYLVAAAITGGALTLEGVDVPQFAILSGPLRRFGLRWSANAEKGLMHISTKSWLFLVLSGLATGASWLCYYKALQIGEASKVVPIDKLSVVITLILAFIFLHEQFTIKSLLGCVLIGAGTLLMVL
jgi:drug/metabolite transporter (DMT)-like permease